MNTNTKPTRPMERTDGSNQPPSGADVGGVPTNLQHGLFEDDAAGAPAGADAPLDADWAAREAAAKGDTDPDAGVAKPAERREPGHIDSALESLGEAISDPVREAAEEVSNDTGTDAARRTSR
ncbi:hypothetical protein RD110_01555 [Rhodoferax koreense]|uniref:Uncharacterized protein n=1 Tax=Rhodoferax koreensis TaxID=1842727 RepID=A0A1P8JQM1_9BURK|nr:hypothetical protein [Rhodoferax koreense]APW36053.1 hypothetical protein RD110_01555 [Rhodoferax koreense]